MFMICTLKSSFLALWFWDLFFMCDWTLWFRDFLYMVFIPFDPILRLVIGRLCLGLVHWGPILSLTIWNFFIFESYIFGSILGFVILRLTDMKNVLLICTFKMYIYKNINLIFHIIATVGGVFSVKFTAHSDSQLPKKINFYLLMNIHAYLRIKYNFKGNYFFVWILTKLTDTIIYYWTLSCFANPPTQLEYPV